MLTLGGGDALLPGRATSRGVELAEALAVMTRRTPNARRTGPGSHGSRCPGLSGPTTLPVEFDTSR